MKALIQIALRLSLTIIFIGISCLSTGCSYKQPACQIRPVISCKTCYCNNTMTDENIMTSIRANLASDPALAYQLIKVESYERAVTLTGVVQNPTQARIAVCLAKSVTCVKSVVAKLAVKPSYAYAY